MKLKELLYLAGLKPKPKIYPYKILDVPLELDSPFQYAQWQHPRFPRNFFTQSHINMFRRFLAPGDVAIDIGAHIGDSTLPIALAVGNTGTVLALEPNRYLFEILRKNAELNPTKTHIVPLLFAATPTDGEFEFEYSDSGFCNGGNHEGISRWRHAHAFKLKVQGKNLLNYLRANHSDLLPKITFLKVDAEGYDHTILQSLTDLLTANRPFIKAEVFKLLPEPKRLEFLQFLQSLGYTVHRTVDESNFLGPLLTPANLMEKKHYDIFCIPPNRTVRS